MPETIEIEVPRHGIGSDLSDALAARGLRAEVVDDGDAYKLLVSFADDEHERLVADTTHALETYLSDRMLPLVVQRTEGGSVVVRPPAE
jgi:hypothetical protein